MFEISHVEGSTLDSAAIFLYLIEDNVTSLGLGQARNIPTIPSNFCSESKWTPNEKFRVLALC
jgi:hypothetical protein